MKICGYCGAENEDTYLFCMGCTKGLPRQEKLDSMLSITQDHLDKREFRKAYREAEKLLKLNEGSRKAWFFRAVAARKLRMTKHVMECFHNSGVDYELKACQDCRCSGKCRECGEGGKCFMCNGVGTCPICNGMGKCVYCNGADPNCAACKGTGACPRCKGSTECPECNGLCTCPFCKGSKECHVCGGTRKALVVKRESVEPELRKYLDM